VEWSRVEKRREERMAGTL